MVSKLSGKAVKRESFVYLSSILCFHITGLDGRVKKKKIKKKCFIHFDLPTSPFPLQPPPQKKTFSKDNATLSNLILLTYKSTSAKKYYFKAIQAFLWNKQNKTYECGWGGVAFCLVGLEFGGAGGSVSKWIENK